jgi:hypothetical protein
MLRSRRVITTNARLLRARHRIELLGFDAVVQVVGFGDV